tara:strand:- start:1496 stop:1942 length:447 start_codon:yes stop_codon:yes gene_type:complete
VKVFLILPILIGFSAVMQGVLNRFIAKDWGFAKAVFFNNSMSAVFAGIFLSVVLIFPQFFPAGFKQQGEAGAFHLWYLIPGFLGFFLVMGIPWALTRMSALEVFVIMILSQLVVSLFWDTYFESIDLSLNRILSLVFAGLAAYFLNRG